VSLSRTQTNSLILLRTTASVASNGEGTHVSSHPCPFNCAHKSLANSTSFSRTDKSRSRSQWWNSLTNFGSLSRTQSYSLTLLRTTASVVSKGEGALVPSHFCPFNYLICRELNEFLMNWWQSLTNSAMKFSHELNEILSLSREVLQVSVVKVNELVSLQLLHKQIVLWHVLLWVTCLA